MDRQDNNKKKSNNVIDLTERIQTNDPTEKMKGLKVRFDLERSKVALTTSLLSIVLLVTLANNNLMKTQAEVEPTAGGRGIASLSTGTSEVEDGLVRALAERELTSQAAVGRKPSSLENLAFGTLEGKYAVRLHNGKLKELEFTATSSGDDRPKHIENVSQFLDSNRELIPVEYDKTVMVQQDKQDGEVKETYQLINEISRPLASVEVRMDGAGRLLSMRFIQMQVAAR